MLHIVPKELNERLIYILEEKLPYTPPELIYMRWEEVQDEIAGFLPADKNELNDWQKKVLTIWTQKEYK
jgi:hypothetical protein